MTHEEHNIQCNAQPPVEEMPAFDMEAVQRDNARLNQAIIFATERHAGQLRKGTALPYILHPLETLQILSEMQADMDLQIAGVLHDVLEDTNTTLEELITLFGEDVASLVNHHSEDKSRSWAERKTTAVLAAKQADERIKMLILADKLSNLRAISRDYAALGDTLWERFNAPKEKQAWYYNGIL
ncbi:MAG: bifunctional (p)ppGpp synthetase/guanosine-3',5'-bis(diphosphate) 3'-pyrophosphohydrolase, partial [Peptococcaceae bacterium]|nr:bifunctional (p)ppGpp synthetase/guanosine-3',5'-bis(diphosphate) 3'-pyrophosphohydrolase [Peptococcaceae bacterium]